ncbi:MAG: hypothetical protein HUU22_07960 [Phycisphaerae bacterium]|nr:hypothetical protein [Phycisphaerae bacterium]
MSVATRAATPPTRHRSLAYRSVACFSAGLVLAATPVGCRRETAAARPAATRGETLSPAEVVARANQARSEGRFGDLGAFVAAETRDAQIALLLAIDQVVAGSRSLRAVVAERFGEGTALGFDLSGVADSCGALSQNVRIVREEISDADDTAVVVVQEGDHLPLVDVRLKKIDGEWRLDLERPDARLISRLETLATTVNHIRTQVSRPGSTYEELENAFNQRVWPILADIARSGTPP